MKVFSLKKKKEEAISAFYFSSAVLFVAMFELLNNASLTIVLYY